MSSFKEAVKDLRERYKNTDCDDAAREAADIVRLQFSDKTFPFKIGKALRELGFNVWVKNFKDKDLSGILAINVDEKTKLAATVNANDNHGHQAFTLAHELAHYIFDVDDLDNKKFVANYRTDIDSSTDFSENRANRFAANLLMPQTEFNEIYQKVSGIKNANVRSSLMASYFGVSSTAINRRIVELGIKDV